MNNYEVKTKVTYFNLQFMNIRIENITCKNR